MRRLIGNIVILIILVSSMAYAQDDIFQDCGTLIQGVECILFDSDNFGLYVLDNLGGFSVGDRVRVEGILNSSCTTFCMQGDGCIEQNQITSCADFDDCGTLIQGAECILFDSDHFGVYEVWPLGDFGVGDRVRVTGRLYLSCTTFCMGGDGCIENVTIVACPEIPTLTEWGLIIFGVVLLGFISWVFFRRRKAVVSLR
jgi:LPXTG-motif cell wall-anchored protein